eukprot:6175835-Pleurochrysis_carterae.AAC.1
MPLVGGADLNGMASGDPTDLRFNRLYRASPTGLAAGISICSFYRRRGCTLSACFLNENCDASMLVN